MKKHCFRSENSLEIFDHVIDIDYFITINHLIINVSDSFQRSDILSLVLDKKHLQYVVDRNFRIYQDSNDLKSAQNFYLQISINSYLMKI